MDAPRVGPDAPAARSEDANDVMRTMERMGVPWLGSLLVSIGHTLTLVENTRPDPRLGDLSALLDEAADATPHLENPLLRGPETPDAVNLHIGYALRALASYARAVEHQRKVRKLRAIPRHHRHEE